MRTALVAATILLAAAWTLAAAPAAPAPAKEAAAGKPIRIVILGDSTVCNYPAGNSKAGWGQFLGEAFKPGTVAVSNLAASGRSTKTFIKEGRLQKAVEEKADFALIQFGHNDSHAKDKPEATDAATDFRENLRTYVDDFRKAGTEPIFVTPMHRRLFRASGGLTQELKPYADAMNAVAAEKKVPVVDLYTASGEFFEKVGQEAGADLNCTPTDRTHFSPKGARAMVELILPGLRAASPRLAAMMKDAAPAAEKK